VPPGLPAYVPAEQPNTQQPNAQQPTEPLSPRQVVLDEGPLMREVEV
jgi:hypothetical protein